jgi:hypothetical protein
MLITYSSTTRTILHALFGYPLPDSLRDEPRLDALAFEAEYAYRSGYRLGANGEWIVLDGGPGA